MIVASVFFSFETVKVLQDASYILLMIVFLSMLTILGRSSPEERIIGVIIVLTLISDSIARLLIQAGVRNQLLYHIYVPILFTTVSTYYWKSRPSFFNKEGVVVVVISFLVLSVFNSFVFQKDTFNSYAIALSSLLFVIFAIWSLYLVINKQSESLSYRMPKLWFNLGILTYHSSAFVLFFVIGGMMETRTELITAAWVLNGMFYLFMIICFWLALFSRKLSGR